MNKTKIYHEPWGIFSNKYIYTISPSTPSKQDMDVIEEQLIKILKTNKKPIILILGCTINYRKLLAKYKLHVDMVDLSKEMYEVNTYVLTDIKRDETIIYSNWVDMKLRDKYDLILGDFVTNNIPIKDLNIFLMNVKDHLKGGGVYITRIFNQPTRLLGKNELCRQYENKKITRELMTELWWDALFNLGVDLDNNKLINKKGFKELKDFSKKYSYMGEWINSYEKLLPTEDKEWTILKCTKQEQMLKSIFDISRISYSMDYKYCEICPTYVMVRK